MNSTLCAKKAGPHESVKTGGGSKGAHKSQLQRDE